MFPFLPYHYEPTPTDPENSTLMDSIPDDFPILNYVMERLPALTQQISNDLFDIENPRPLENKQPHFELAERMPHLKNPKLISAMRRAVSDVAQTRSVLRSLGARPDHEIVDAARFRLAEIDKYNKQDESEELRKEYKTYKAVIAMDEMHDAYEKMLGDAEKRLEKIYEAAVAGLDFVEDDGKEAGSQANEVNEEVVRILMEAEQAKLERLDLSGKKVRALPEAFGRLKYLVVLNLSSNQLKAIPDSVSGLENLEQLDLSQNLLETLPDSIRMCYNLKILNVSGNNLTVLPEGITHCRALEELNASFNKLAYLPTNIGFELVNLKKLIVYLNKIRSLPTSIGDMKSLQVLDVHFNELRGLPHSIGGLTNLEILNLSSNFSDLNELPETISDLSNLKELDLSNNQIHQLPNTFGRLLNLSKLNLDQNPIQVPPKEIVSRGVEAVKIYMTKRWAEMLTEEEKKRMEELQAMSTQSGLLTRTTSWLTSTFSAVTGTVGAYLGSIGKTEADRHLDKEY